MEEKKKLSLDAIGFSDKLWKEAQLERPVIYVMYKRNSLNEMVEFVDDVAELRKRLRLAGLSNFYTDFDKAYPENLETAKKWLAVFSERVNEEEGLCAEIKAISKKYKFVDEDQMFGCFNRSSEMAFHLIGRKEDYGSRLYYWSYENPVTKEFNGMEKPIKFRLEEPQEGSVKGFLIEAVSNEAPRFFLSEDEPKSEEKQSLIGKVVKSTFNEWMKNSLETHHVVLFTHTGDYRIHRNLFNIIEKALKKYHYMVKFGRLSSQQNDIDELGDFASGNKVFCFKRGERDQFKKRNLETLKGLMSILWETFPELRDNDFDDENNEYL